MVLDQVAINTAVQTASGGFEVAKLLSQKVFLVTSLALFAPTLLTLLIATVNKSILSSKFIMNTLIPELLRIVILIGALTGFSVYLTSNI